MRALLVVLVAVAVVEAVSNGGYPALEGPMNGGFPSLDFEHPDEPVEAGDPWPPGEVPPLDYTPTPYDPRPDHVIGLLKNASVGVSGFDVARSKRYLWHSYATYCAPNLLQKFLCVACKRAAVSVTVIDVVETNGLLAYVLYDKSRSEIVVAFRGSHNIENWIANVQIWKAESNFLNLPNAKVAKGFNDGYNALHPRIVAAVKKARKDYGQVPLVITGHSLGGALAAMVALHLKIVEGISANEVFTFGSPRIGNHDFALAYATRLPKTYRMSNNRDIVPHLPPKAFKFLHYDQEIWEVGASYKECGRGAEDPKCANSVLLPNNVYDHLHYMQEERIC